MLKQMKTRDTGLLGIMQTAAFSTGFKEAQAGKPIRYDAYDHDANGQWNYERGRLLGLIFNGPLKVGRAINRGAAVELARAFHFKIIL
ncbi:hypothetical protein UFOVP120_28 [uncultured Caudovirales phage]|uniref:Uncharacterized protein n=1 Tax=uncultured Caudovirales phage TaxID=2100421 RepID=A0A6J5L899_9CAUD|nr:hypothetical protein UFOVP120_28 [uncultured Caudovirales phage]